MKASLINLLFEQRWLQLLRVLSFSKKGKGVRELADILEVSTSGVHDILRRLAEKGIVRARRHRGRLLYTVAIDREEKRCLDGLIRDYEEAAFSAKAKGASRESAARMKWLNDNLSALGML